MITSPAAEEFLADVSGHRMRIVLDQGFCRCVRFRRPDTTNMYFDVVTWPGHLAISGDMSCYVFCRLDDMFEFFRLDTPREPDFRYWASKVVAQDVSSPVWEFSQDKFRECIEADLDDFCESRDVSAADRAVAWTELNDEVFSRLDADQDGRAAVSAAMDFELGGRHVFQDFHEHNLRELSWRFVWCCRAVAWAVAQYDAREVPTFSTTPALLAADPRGPTPCPDCGFEGCPECET